MDNVEESFHRARIMFCIREGKVEIGPPGSPLSHAEWFREQGWMSADTADAFMSRTPRGFFLPGENSLFCYWGAEFSFDDRLVSRIRDKICSLQELLHLSEDTKIIFGPRDAIIGTKTYRTLCAGSLREFAKQPKKV
jgi:hypothetical protein